MDSKYPFHSNCGCLNTDSDAALKIFSEESSQDQQCSDYYSQTNLHNLSDPDSLKKIIISKESIHALRLNTLQKRILITLNGIQLLLSNGPQPDGVEDLKRRQQRAAEFSSRFCRNYLYQLQRQINNITKMWKSLSNNHSHASYFVLCQKVITAHQNAHLALQAYLHHMPCSVERGIPDKLEEILQVVNDLCSFCSKLGMSEGDSNMKVVKQCCEQLMTQIKSKEVKKREGSSTSLPHSSGQKAPKPLCKKEIIPYRFSMYSGNALERNNMQNKKPVKISDGLTRRPSKTQCNKYNLRESNFPTKLKQNNTLKTSMYFNYGDDKEDQQFGEVSAGDNIRTMIECFLTEEPSHSSEIVPATSIPNVITELVIDGHQEDKSLHSYKKTLKKLESEINSLKEQTQSLRENDNSNYPIYIHMLESMFRRLNRMKSQKHKEDTSPRIVKCEPETGESEGVIPLSFKLEQQNENTAVVDNTEIPVKSKTNPEAEKKNSSQYPKNVKLVCLTSKEEKPEEQSKPLCQPISIAVRSISKTPECINSKSIPTTPEREIEEKNRTTLLEYKNTPENRDSKNEGHLYSLKNRATTPTDFHQDFQSGEQNSNEQNIHSQHPIFSESCSTGGRKEQVHQTKQNKPFQLTMSESDKSAAYAYHQAFHNYMGSQSLYEDTIKPWEVISRIANNLLENVLEDIVLHDTGIQKITSGLLQLEFQ